MLQADPLLPPSDAVAPALWLINPLRPDRLPVRSQAVGDPASVAGLVLPASLAFELRLVQRGSRAVPGPDGEPRLLPWTGPVELRVGERRAWCGATVDGDEVRLGLLALEELDLLIDPRTGQLLQDAGAGLDLAGAPDAAALSAWAAPPDAP